MTRTIPVGKKPCFLTNNIIISCCFIPQPSTFVLFKLPTDNKLWKVIYKQCPLKKSILFEYNQNCEVNVWLKFRLDFQSI